jgi:hypothetical protein
LTVGNGHDGVVKRSMDVGDAINHCLFNFFYEDEQQVLP